jgi:hypothetical protein
MSDVINPNVPPVAPGHLTLPPPLPLEPGPVGPPPPERAGEENDPFRFGWRYVRRTEPAGSDIYDEVPLSWKDVLYPEEDDFVVKNPRHLCDVIYCHGTLEFLYRNDPSVVILGDCRIDFGVAGLRPLGPDVVVLFGVRRWSRKGTFQVAVEGGRPVLVMEMTSRNSRDHDLAHKPDLFYAAGVQKYVIVDRGREGTDSPRLLAYQRGPRGWLHLPAEAPGWFDLAPVCAFLGLEGDRLRFYEAATGERLLDLTELTIAKEEAEAKTREYAKARAAEEERIHELERQLRAQQARNE